MKAFVRAVCELVDRKEPFVLATVVESTGSTPRSSGAKMAVRADGSIVGTVGGGLLEARACRDAVSLLETGERSARLTFVDMTQELAANSDMICGGGLSVLLEPVAPDGECGAVYHELDGRMRRGEPSTLVTLFAQDGALRVADHELLPEAPSRNLEFSREGDDLRLVEPFIPPAPLFIFGAGHVSLFTARVGAMIGFRTVVLDDRADYANVERFPEADEVVVLDSFDTCCEERGVGEDAFIVIVTRGHLHDRTVLGQALRTKAKYVGMIGSKKKRDKIYDALLADGFTQADIDRCHCPIGLSIGAQTPEEIAVSIAGELIRVRAGA